ncbi:MAG: DUF58 domain-containing protein [Deltaproteobacteria bacterium]|nr:DUF58 domain-containing protein [Deltaproteobacteria bacterium]
MNLRPAISVPLPWLTIFIGKVFGGKRRSAPRASWARSLSVTREGKWYIGILFLIGIAAINTGNNLLYLVAAMLLSLIVVSGVASEHTLRRLTVTRTWPGHIYKGSPAVARLSVANNKRIFSTFSITVRELPADGCDADAAYILKINPGEEARRTAAYTFKRRGRFALTGVKVQTRFPFGLFLKGKEERCPAEALVYPDITAGRRHPGPADASPASTGQTPSGRGPGSELYALRGYTQDDPARFIYWKAAARASRLLVKEFERETEKTVTVVFDNYRTEEAAFEELVDEAASSANRFIERGYSVGLKTLDGEIKPGAGPDQLHRILRTLALMEPAGQGRAAGTPGVRVVHRG